MPIQTAISFALVHIPVTLLTATQDEDIHFNQLHKEDHERIRYKKVCGHCGEEVKQKDIIKGFQYEKDKYVVMSDADFESIKTEKDKAINIMHFAKLNEISPVYYDKTYHEVPQKGGEKAFELLRTAMLNQQRVAISKCVIGEKETLIALIPREDGMLAQTMFFDEEIKELPQSYDKAKVSKPELDMAKQIISSMEKPFAPEEYKDEYQAKLKELIVKKIAGKRIVKAKNKPAGNVIDLMQALKGSIEQAKAKPTPKKPTRKSKGA